MRKKREGGVIVRLATPPSTWEYMKSLCGSKRGYRHLAHAEGVTSIIGIGLMVMETGFYRGMSSRHGPRVRTVQGILSCYVMGTKELEKPI